MTKITFQRKSLADTFHSVSEVCPGRTTKDILKDVLFSFSPAGGVLAATDSEISLKQDVPDMVTQDGGQIVLPAEKMRSILRAIQDDAVTMTIQGTDVTVKCGYSKFRLQTKPAQDFPPIDGFSGESYYTIPSPALRSMIRRSVFGIDPVGGSRYATNGVLMQFDGNRLTMVSTDSRRMPVVWSEVTATGNPPSMNDINPIVPKKGLSILENLLGDSGDCQIAIRQNEIAIRYSGATLISKLCNGLFPMWENVIPDSLKTTIEMVQGPLMSALKQAMIVRVEESLGVDFLFSKGLLSLNSKAAGLGDSVIEMPIPYDGDEMHVRLVPEYLVDFLKTLDAGETIRVRINAEEEAIMLEAGANYRYIVMPLAVE